MKIEIYKRKNISESYYTYIEVKDNMIIFKLQENNDNLTIIGREVIIELTDIGYTDLKLHYEKYNIKVTEKELETIYSNDTTIIKMIIDIFINRIYES